MSKEDKYNAKVSLASFDKDDVANVLKYYQCCLCNGLLQETVQCDMGHFFCAPCLSRYLKVGNNLCPKNNYHNLEGKTLKKAKHIDETIEYLTINCKNREEGCHWKGKLKYHGLHLHEECKFDKKYQPAEEEEEGSFEEQEEEEDFPREDYDDEDMDDEMELESDHTLDPNTLDPESEGSDIDVQVALEENQELGLRENEELALHTEEINEEEEEPEEEEPEEEQEEEQEKSMASVEADIDNKMHMEDLEEEDFVMKRVKSEDPFIKRFTEELQNLCLSEPEEEETCASFIRLKEYMFNRFDELHASLDKEEEAIERQNRLLETDKSVKRFIPCLMKHETITYKHRSIELVCCAERRAPMLLFDVPSTTGAFSIELQVFCKIRRGWIALGVCEAEVAKRHECEFHRQDFEGYAIFTTNGYCFNGYEKSAYQVQFQKGVNYRTILRLSYNPSLCKLTLGFRDQEIDMEVRTRAVLYPVIMFFGDISRLVIIS